MSGNCDFEIILTIINNILLLLLFLRFILRWIDDLNPADDQPKLLYKVSFSILSFAFCIFLLYPTIATVYYFILCKYYLFGILLTLSYKLIPWITAKLIAQCKEELGRQMMNMGNDKRETGSSHFQDSIPWNTQSFARDGPNVQPSKEKLNRQMMNMGNDSREPQSSQTEDSIPWNTQSFAGDGPNVQPIIEIEESKTGHQQREYRFAPRNHQPPPFPLFPCYHNVDSGRPSGRGPASFPSEAFPNSNAGSLEIGDTISNSGDEEREGSIGFETFIEGVGPVSPPRSPSKKKSVKKKKQVLFHKPKTRKKKNNSISLHE